MLREKAFGGIQQARLRSHTFVSIIRMNQLLSSLLHNMLSFSDMKHCIGLLAITAALAQPPTAKKVYISVDLEGISGVASETMVSAAGSEYDRGRKLMADDTNAAEN